MLRVRRIVSCSLANSKCPETGSGRSQHKQLSVTPHLLEQDFGIISQSRNPVVLGAAVRVVHDSGGIRRLRVPAGYHHFSAHAKGIVRKVILSPALPTRGEMKQAGCHCRFDHCYGHNRVFVSYQHLDGTNFQGVGVGHR